jgi:fatty acid desaturase
MSEDHTEHHHEDIERVETISSTMLPWGVRLGFAIAGLVLLAGAIVAWMFRGSLSGPVAEALPWVIVIALVLAALAIIESITVEIWLALIIGAFAVVIAFIVVGTVSAYPAQGQAVFVVERFTGEVEYCTPDGCKLLPHNGALQPQLHK